MNFIKLDEVDAVIDLALREDIGSGDITTDSLVPGDMWGTGQITAKKPTVVAGMFLLGRIYGRLSDKVTIDIHVSEGKKVSAGTVICRFEGPYSVLLKGERTVLNFLQRLCGVASLTRRYVAATKGGKSKIYDTRKTSPAMRTLEKYAVRTGGGTNHRTGLFDAILIKENHIAAAAGVPEAIRLARSRNPGVRVEIEVTTIEELVLAVEYGADIVLLDNMTVGDVSRAVAMVGERVELEVSGGVTLARVPALASTGVHRISVGALTHSAPAADLSMLIVPVSRVRA